MRDAPPPGRRERPPVVAGPVPDQALLREASLAHLARFAASEAGLVRVLDRRIRRWASRAEAAGAEAAEVAAQSQAARREARAVAMALVRAGVLDDAAYAEARARSLVRGGRSRRAALAHLAGRGIGSELAQGVLPEDRDTELAAALVQARRRRIGPFAAVGTDEDADPDGLRPPDPRRHDRALAALARAGFTRETAERALALDRDAADALIEALKRG